MYVNGAVVFAVIQLSGLQAAIRLLGNKLQYLHIYSFLNFTQPGLYIPTYVTLTQSSRERTK